MESVEETVMDYARTALGEYKTRQTANGTEFVAKYCPICNGGTGSHRDMWTFALSTNGAANCKRGTCGFRGTINDLLKMEGKEPLRFRFSKMDMTSSKKNYTLPKTETVELTQKCRDYLHTRGFSDNTINSFHLNSDTQGNIVFNFIWHGQIVYQKFRAPEKFVKGNGKPKEWQVSNTEPILMNLDDISLKTPLVITEGECDAMAVFEAGYTNVTSVPCGCDNLTWIDNCWDTLMMVDTIILFGDADEPGQKMVEDLKNRLSICNLQFIPLEAYPTRPDGKVCKDANEVLVRYGKEKVLEMIGSAESCEIKGLIDFADIRRGDPNNKVRIPIGIPGLDRATGGLQEGGITIVTGDPGSGKSTSMGITIINAIEHGFPVCVYSGELSAEDFQEWITLQAAGDEYVGLRYDEFEKSYEPWLDDDVYKRICEHFRGKLKIYDNELDTPQGILKAVTDLFEGAFRRYGSKLFFVDNLMSLGWGSSGDDNAVQGEIIQTMKHFALKHHVHVVIVAHLRKTSPLGRSKVTLNDIAGNSMSVKAADNVFLVENQAFKVLKNRKKGRFPITEFCFCPASRRIYQADIGDTLVCNWDRDGASHPTKRADSLDDYKIKPPPVTNEPI